MLTAGKGWVLAMLAMLPAKRRVRVAVRGSGPGAKWHRPCPTLRAVAVEKHRGEERPEPTIRSAFQAPRIKQGTEFQELGGSAAYHHLAQPAAA